jgi:hypothetical protein
MLNTVPAGAHSSAKDLNTGSCVSSRKLEMGIRTALTKESKALFSTFPSSQNAAFNFFFSAAGGSKKSILLLGSELDIFPPVRPGNIGFMR